MITLKNNKVSVTADYCINGTHPEWKKTWKIKNLRSCTGNNAYLKAMRPFNPISNYTYSGRNSTRLYLPLWEQFKIDGEKIDLRFASRHQIESRGGKISDNATAHKVVFNGKRKDGMFSKTFDVFNFKDVTGLDDKYATKDFNFEIKSRKTGVKDAIQMIKNLNVKTVKIYGVQPSFVPHENMIYMNWESAFDSVDALFETFFHELVHWTKYNFPSCSRSFAYPQEEITAQLGSLILIDRFGMKTRSEVYDYLKSWLDSYPKSLKSDVWDESEQMATNVCNKLLSFI